MKMISFFVLVCIGSLLIASASASAGVGCQGSDLPSKGTISMDIKGKENWNKSFEYKQAQALFDSTKMDLFNRKIESLSDSPPAWEWEHSIGDKFYDFDGTKWVEDPGHCWHDPKNCSVLNLPSLFPGFTKNGIW
jgi:hypothetical protein